MSTSEQEIEGQRKGQARVKFLVITTLLVVCVAIVLVSFLSVHTGRNAAADQGAILGTFLGLVIDLGWPTWTIIVGAYLSKRLTKAPKVATTYIVVIWCSICYTITGVSYIANANMQARKAIQAVMADALNGKPIGEDELNNPALGSSKEVLRRLVAYVESVRSDLSMFRTAVDGSKLSDNFQIKSLVVNSKVNDGLTKIDYLEGVLQTSEQRVHGDLQSAASIYDVPNIDSELRSELQENLGKSLVTGTAHIDQYYEIEGSILDSEKSMLLAVKDAKGDVTVKDGQLEFSDNAAEAKFNYALSKLQKLSAQEQAFMNGAEAGRQQTLKQISGGK